jgi:hypothetical protein
MKIRMIDPSPEGYRYGFPKPYNPEKDGNLDEFLKAHGYPYIDSCVIRQWETEE